MAIKRNALIIIYGTSCDGKTANSKAINLNFLLIYVEHFLPQICPRGDGITGDGYHRCSTCCNSTFLLCFILCALINRKDAKTRSRTQMKTSCLFTHLSSMLCFIVLTLHEETTQRHQHIWLRHLLLALSQQNVDDFFRRAFTYTAWKDSA